MFNQKILRKEYLSQDQEWNEITEEEVERDYSLPISPMEHLLNGKIIYSQQYIYRLASTPYPEYPDTPLKGDVIFRNNSGQDVNWSEKLNHDDSMIETLIGGAYADQWKGRLNNGKILSFPLGTLRLSTTSVQNCPICGKLFLEYKGALSRKDNETLLCSSCGLNEAMEEMAESEKVKIKLYHSHFAWVSQALLREFEEVTGIKRKPEWIKQKAFEDFGITIQSSEDIPKLDKHVRANFYEDKGEWLKEKMRNEIRHYPEALEEAVQRLEQNKGLKNPRTIEHNLNKVADLLTKVLKGAK